MNIRKADINDIPQLISMRWQFTLEHEVVQPEVYKECTDIYAEFLKSALNDSRWTIWLSEREGKILSHVYIQQVDVVPRPGKKLSPLGYVTNVYTLPEYRNRGICGEILEKAKLFAKEENLELLIVWPSNKSINFYQRHGFSQNTENMVAVLNAY
ncbi:GNAT family N-acetyltransferase [Paenibacillus sp. UNC451MF]|uniref:GNAT family N-acetyltransferase n=1 Tax=Paenibacillus sp. UNC451MF TaxID=1449063 RepID=UPI00048AA5D7|nr:GNAT family N-acetyltransferase [Paenibacillus sp. UNC451MF]